MDSLSINHVAKGIMLWAFPTEDQLAQANAEQAKVFQVAPVIDFLLGAQPRGIRVEGHLLLDVACWISGGQAMVGVFSLAYDATNGTISIPLPFEAGAVAGQPWGTVDWSLGDNTLMV